jgi:hypothetical protein
LFFYHHLCFIKHLCFKYGYFANAFTLVVRIFSLATFQSLNFVL